MAEQISVIIPAYNEADIIAATIAAVRKIPGLSQLIVVDDASTDATAQAAEAAGADLVIRQSRNTGKGGALNRGFAEANGDIILMLDADLGKTASEAVKLLKPVIDNTADMTIGVFNSAASYRKNNELAAKSGGFGTAVKIARWGIKTKTGALITAPLSGQRALKREIIEKTKGFAGRFGVETALTIDALRMGYRVVEVPVNMMHRPSGRSIAGFIHRGRQMWDIICVLMTRSLA